MIQHLSFLLLCYMAGQFVSLYWHASQSAQSQWTPWQTVRQYTTAHFADYLYRWFVATILFFALWQNPQILERGVNYALSVANLAGALGDLEIRMNFIVAAMFGLASDRIADIVIGLFKKIGKALGDRFGS